MSDEVEMGVPLAVPGLPDEDLAWQALALCAQTDPEAFFPDKGGSNREAKRVCASCEVREQCLQYSLDHDEKYGIWGGLSEFDRRKVRNGTYKPAEVLRAPEHGTLAMYRRGCTDEWTCPRDVAGVACIEAYRAYQQRRRDAIRRARQEKATRRESVA